MEWPQFSSFGQIKGAGVRVLGMRGSGPLPDVYLSTSASEAMCAPNGVEMSRPASQG